MDEHESSSSERGTNPISRPVRTHQSKTALESRSLALPCSFTLELDSCQGSARHGTSTSDTGASERRAAQLDSHIRDEPLILLHALCLNSHTLFLSGDTPFLNGELLFIVNFSVFSVLA